MNSRMTCAAGRSCAWQALKNSSRRAFSTRMRRPTSFPDMAGVYPMDTQSAKGKLIHFPAQMCICYGNLSAHEHGGYRGSRKAPLLRWRRLGFKGQARPLGFAAAYDRMQGRWGLGRAKVSPLVRKGSMPVSAPRPEGCNGRAQRSPLPRCAWYYHAHLAGRVSAVLPALTAP